MSSAKSFHCIVDDTALITNISEIEQWVVRGLVTLVIPLHTLERLHLLKKDTSQIGMNARKAVKFLDQVTSKDDLPHDPVIIQGPDDQYATWSEVEAHYVEQRPEAATTKGDRAAAQEEPKKVSDDEATFQSATTGAVPLSQLLLDKLNCGKEPNTSSPLSTPPLSPSSSGPQSSKTSPEVKSATMIHQDLTPVPPTLKALINPLVWYSYEKKTGWQGQNMVFLTNSADTAQLAREFGITPKNIHQLRTAIGVEEQEAKNRDKFQKKHVTSPTSTSFEPEPKTLFRYEEESSEEEEEEVVFKPRGRGGARVAASVRGQPAANIRPRSGHGHSPAASLSSAIPNKPQIPTEEIDPNSFDRGSFARGSTPLVSVGNHNPNTMAGNGRGQYRGNFAPVGPRGAYPRGGAPRAGRGRGRLFVP